LEDNVCARQDTQAIRRTRNPAANFSASARTIWTAPKLTSASSSDGASGNAWTPAARFNADPTRSALLTTTDPRAYARTGTSATRETCSWDVSWSEPPRRAIAAMTTIAPAVSSALSAQRVSGYVSIPAKMWLVDPTRSATLMERAIPLAAVKTDTFGTPSHPSARNHHCRNAQPTTIASKSPPAGRTRWVYSNASPFAQSSLVPRTLFA